MQFHFPLHPTRVMIGSPITPVKKMEGLRILGVYNITEKPQADATDCGSPSRLEWSPQLTLQTVHERIDGL